MIDITQNFDQLDENQLVMVLNQVARRMLILRQDTLDSPFWYSVIMRVSKWLTTAPVMTETEKQLLINPPETSTGRMKAIRSMRARTGSNITVCRDIIDDWIKNNINIVHNSVRVNYLASTSRVQND